MKDLHTEHCCIIHGCKYNDLSCTVRTGEKIQSFKCEECDFDVWGDQGRDNNRTGVKMGDFGNFRPIKDAATALLHRANSKRRIALSRREREYCDGYEQGIKDFITEIVEIQKVYIWEYKIRENKNEHSG